MQASAGWRRSDSSSFFSIAIWSLHLPWRSQILAVCPGCRGNRADDRALELGRVQPRYWLIWYPVHHDLLMIGFLRARC